LFVKPQYSATHCAYAFYLCLNSTKYKEFENFTEPPLILMDSNVELTRLRNGDQFYTKEIIFDYFIEFSNLELFLKFNLDFDFLYQMFEWFTSWKKEKFESKTLNDRLKISTKSELIEEFEFKFHKLYERLEADLMEFWIVKIKKQYKSFKEAPLNVKNNKKVLKVILNIVPGYLRFTDKEVRDDDEIVESIKNHHQFYRAYPYLSERFKMDQEIVDWCLKKSWKCFMYLPRKFKTKETILKYLNLDIRTNRLIRSIPDEYFADKSFLIKFMDLGWIMISDLPLKYRFIHKEVILESLKTFNRQYFNVLANLECYKHDIDILKATISRNFEIYAEFSDDIKRSKDITDQLFEFDVCIFGFLCVKFQTEKNFVKVLKSKSEKKFTNMNYKSVPKEFSENSDLLEFAMEINPRNLKLFSPKNEKFLRGVLLCFRKFKPMSVEDLSYYLEILKSKIFLLIPNLKLSSIEVFNEEEDAILCEIFLEIHQMYPKLVFDTKIKSQSNILFRFQ
jgi:hypothetical protein